MKIAVAAVGAEVWTLITRAHHLHSYYGAVPPQDSWDQFLECSGVTLSQSPLLMNFIMLIN